MGPIEINRRRVERLLNGLSDPKPDLIGLLFWLRDTDSENYRHVAEVGNFIAHPRHRTKGATVDLLCAVRQYHETYLLGQDPGYPFPTTSFNDYVLFNEFERGLLETKLLSDDERTTFGKLKIHLTLLTIASLHMCLISFERGTPTLYATVRDGRIRIEAALYLVLPNAGAGLSQVSIFDTRLVAQDFVDASLTPNHLGQYVTPLDISRAPQLVAL